MRLACEQLSNVSILHLCKILLQLSCVNCSLMTTALKILHVERFHGSIGEGAMTITGCSSSSLANRCVDAHQDRTLAAATSVSARSNPAGFSGRLEPVHNNRPSLASFHCRPLKASRCYKPSASTTAAMQQTDVDRITAAPLTTSTLTCTM